METMAGCLQDQDDFHTWLQELWSMIREQIKLDTLLIWTLSFTESKYGSPRNGMNLNYVLLCSILKLSSLEYTFSVSYDLVLKRFNFLQ